MCSLPHFNLFLLLSLIFLFFTTETFAQTTATTSSELIPATTSIVSLTPEMSASSVASVFAALATATPTQNGDPEPGDAGSSPGSGDSDAGASGSDSGSITISKGGIVAISICAVLVIGLGIASSVLWYLAKKRSWEVRKTIRKSAKRVATALTPRRTTFPKDIQSQRRSVRGLAKIDEVPPTPKFYGLDVEKGAPKMSTFEMSEPPKKSKWAKKLGK